MKNKNTAFFYGGIAFFLLLTLLFAPVTSFLIQLLLLVLSVLMSYNAYNMYKRAIFIQPDSSFDDTVVVPYINLKLHTVPKEKGGITLWRFILFYY